MTTGIQDAGTDLDSVFEPRTTAKISDVNYHSNGGVDISNRFEKIASGSAGSLTNHHKAGADLNTLFAGIGTVSSLAVNFQSNGRVNYLLDAACYAGVRYYTTGVEYEITSTNGSSSQGNWLTSGSASGVWILHVKTSGNVTSFTGKTNNVRYQINVNQSWRVAAITGGSFKTITGYFRAYDAASGGNLLDQSPTDTYSAENDGGGGCPLCCFTPDTPVMLASGIQMPIGKVRAGDMIMTPDGPQEVGDVLIREHRKMYRIIFEDDRFLDASDDHPLEVDGKGPSSINPIYDYKDLGTPKSLEVDDVVRKLDGTGWIRVKSITRINYPGRVYTFTNSPFFANGILVY